MKRNLYQIEQQYLELAEQLETGELTPAMEQQLYFTQEELQTKAIKYAYVIKDFENDTEAIDKEIKRLQALKESKTNALDRMKEAISNAMKLFNIEKVEIATLKLSFRRSESVQIMNESEIPKKYIVEKTTYTPNKNEIKKSIKAGENVAGTRLIENFNLQIK